VCLVWLCMWIYLAVSGRRKLVGVNLVVDWMVFLPRTFIGQRHTLVLDSKGAIAARVYNAVEGLSVCEPCGAISHKLFPSAAHDGIVPSFGEGALSRSFFFLRRFSLVPRTATTARAASFQASYARSGVAVAWV